MDPLGAESNGQEHQQQVQEDALPTPAKQDQEQDEEDLFKSAIETPVEQVRFYFLESF